MKLADVNVAGLLLGAGAVCVYRNYQKKTTPTNKK